MHGWAAMSSWSRPSTKLGSDDSLSINGFRSQIGMPRCHTILEPMAQVYKPRTQYHDSCTMDYIRYLRISNKESEAKLRKKMGVMNTVDIHRSKSCMDAQDVYFGIKGVAGFSREVSIEKAYSYMDDVLSSPSKFHRPPPKAVSMRSSCKLELKVSHAVVPRKGLIYLSTEDHEQLGDTMLPERKHSNLSSKPKQHSNVLIKRRDILEQVKAGTKLLEESEEQKQKVLEFHNLLGEYTIMDLQSKIIEMTDVKSVRKLNPFQETCLATSGPSDETTDTAMNKVKPITLPKIKKTNQFTLSFKQ